MCPMRYIFPHSPRGIAIDGILWPLTVPNEFHEKDFVGQIHMELGVRVWKYLMTSCLAFFVWISSEGYHGILPEGKV